MFVTIIKQNTKDRNEFIHSLIEKYLYAETEKKAQMLKEINDNNCVLVNNDSNVQVAKDEIIQFVKQNENKMYSLPGMYALKLYDDKLANISDINNFDIFYDKDADIYHIYALKKRQIFSFIFKVENGTVTYFDGYLHAITLNGSNLYKIMRKENGETFYIEQLFDANVEKAVSELLEKITRYAIIIHDDQESHKETDGVFVPQVEEATHALISGMNSNILRAEYYEVHTILCKTIEYENGYILNIIPFGTKDAIYICYALIEKDNTDNDNTIIRGYFKLDNELQLKVLSFVHRNKLSI